MRIVYISHICADGANGLCWSVPASVKAQSTYDEVYWLNTSNGVMDHWKEVPAFNNVIKSKRSLLSNLPDDFKNPDLVVFEGFYDCILDVLWGRELNRKGIPYVIIPRSALTVAAMNNHARFKKKIAHKLFYNSFIKNAAAIHYLTSGEAQDTIKLFDTPYFIIPNGITIPKLHKTEFSMGGINATFIGRIDIHQKGLDMLLEAMVEKRDLLNNSKFHLNIYGPESSDSIELSKLINDYQIDDLVRVGEKVLGKEKERVLLNSDVFILTSRFEGLPMGLIEALSYGIPCAVTYGTYLGEEIESNNAGWVSNVSTEAIAIMLEQICNSKSIFREISKNARTLSKKYDWDSIAMKTHQEYTRVSK